MAGFPCQPFSTAGKQQGFDDEAGRGTIFFKVREYIKAQSPKVFILENVVGLVRLDGGRYFEAIMRSLGSLGKYNITHQVMDTKDHGVPQNRKRVYIIGISKLFDKGTFEWPQPVARPSIERFLDPRRKRPAETDLPPIPLRKAGHGGLGVSRFNVIQAVKELREKGHDPLREPWVVDCDSTVARMAYQFDRTPCITCGRSKGHWISNRGRRMSLPEMMRLQGMNDKGFVKQVSDLSLGKQIGNAMSVNVLERILVRLLPAAGLYPAARLHDRWDPEIAAAAPSTPIRKRAMSPPRSPLKTKRVLRRITSDSPAPKRSRVGTGKA